MKLFLKNKMVLSGVFMMIFYQVMMIGIFMAGYSAIPKNLPDLTIAIVNEDQQSGAQFVEQLKEQLPFHVKSDLDLAQAKSELEDRGIQFIMHIPAEFTQQLSAEGQQAKLDFFINESNPSTITSSMHSVVTQITSKMTAQIQTQSFEGMLQGMKVPEDQAKQMVEGIMGKIQSNVISTNTPPAGMHNQMAPMFLTMASYVGAMIFSMMIVGTLGQLKGQMGKWRAFGAMQGVNVLVSLVAPLVGVSLYFAVHGYGAEAFFQTWGTHALEMFVSITFTSLFCLLFGQAGMIVNMPVLLSQTIANGSVLPREMMPAYFEWVSYISPMYYTVHLDYNNLFGGGKTSMYLTGLILVGVGAVILNTIIHQFKSVKKPVDAAETASMPSFM